MHACRIVCGYNSGVRLNRRIEGAKQHRMRRVAQVYFLCVCAAVSHIIPAYEKQFFFGQMLTHMFGIIERRWQRRQRLCVLRTQIIAFDLWPDLLRSDGRTNVRKFVGDACLMLCRTGVDRCGEVWGVEGWVCGYNRKDVIDFHRS